MKIALNKNCCIVEREKSDPKFYGDYMAKGESLLLNFLKKELNKQGYDFIKKRMWKDGHLVDEIQQYIRERKVVKTKDGNRMLAIYNTFWQIRGANEDFNDGKVILGIENLVEK